MKQTNLDYQTLIGGSNFPPSFSPSFLIKSSYCLRLKKKVGGREGEEERGRSNGNLIDGAVMMKADTAKKSSLLFSSGWIAALPGGNSKKKPTNQQAG